MARLKIILCALALALLASGTWAAAPKPPAPVVKLVPVTPVGPSPITPDCRYLFVVDTSAAMQRYADGLYRTTHRLIATGLGARMQEGDVFTVWTYADTVLTREFPLNAWTPELNVALANRAYEFLAQQKFRGKSNLRPVFAELGQALAIATNLTIILISDGTDVIVGTPFDRAINVTYGKRASEMRSAKMPFITALATERGEFTQWSVRGGLEDIGLPLPIPPVIARVPAPPPALVVAPPAATNPPPVVLTVPVPKPAATNPPTITVTPAKPIVITNVVAFTPKPATPAPPLVPAPPKPVEVTLPAPTPPTAATAPLKTNVTASAPLPPKPELKPLLPVPLPTAEPPKPAPIVREAKLITNTTPPKLDIKPTSPPPLTEIPKLVAPVVPKPAPPTPVVIAPPTTKVELIPLPLPVVPPPLRQPRSVIEASNPPVKVELLRPPANSTPTQPEKPLAARVIPPAPKPATNSMTSAPAPKTIAIIVPPKREAVATNPPASKTNAVTTTLPKPPTNVLPTPTNVVATAKSSVPTNAPKSKDEPPAAKPTPKPLVTDNASKTNTPAKLPTKATGQLAVAAPHATGGWLYLAAAITLLLAAGGIIAYLLRPRPNPSAISQSLDDKRL